MSKIAGFIASIPYLINKGCFTSILQTSNSNKAFLRKDITDSMNKIYGINSLDELFFTLFLKSTDTAVFKRI